MSLFGNLFSAKKAENVAFIEIGADSVGGAYARFESAKPPTIIYTKRLPYAPREGEQMSCSPLCVHMGSRWVFSEGKWRHNRDKKSVDAR